MSWKRTVFSLGLIAVLAWAATASVPLLASHRWGCYAWSTRSLTVSNEAAGDYFNVYQEEVWSDSNSWDRYTVLVLRPLRSTSANIRMFSGNYGSTGWLGLAQIWPSGCRITRATSKLNNTYLQSYSRTAKKHVACQEVGHTFGLGHNQSSTTTCMNDRILTAPQPNAHDAQLLATMYPAGAAMPFEDGALAEAQWIEYFDNLKEMAGGVDLIVIGTVQRSSPGRIAANDRDDLMEAVPFTDVEFQAEVVLKGALDRARFVVEQTGGPLANGEILSIEDGGRYEPGEHYLLFLNKQPDTDSYYLINPQGRYRIDGDYLRAAAPDDPVAAILHDQSTAEVVPLIKALVP